MSNEIDVSRPRDLTPAPAFDLSPRSLAEALQFADLLSKSDMVPKEYAGKPGNILVAVQWGAEIGLKPLQAMQNIATINGRPSLWGDAALALVRASQHCEYVIETQEGDVATCRAKRRGSPAETVGKFSQVDAVKAGLAGKSGPWSQYPSRMRQLRARAFCLRDAFPDVLKGISIAEEAMDVPAETIVATVQSKPVDVEAQAKMDADAKQRADLIARLEAAAANGVEAATAEFAAIGKDGRKLVGADEWTRIKGNIKPTPPTYAEIMVSIGECENITALSEIMGVNMAHLSDQMRSELAAAAQAKAMKLEEGE